MLDLKTMLDTKAELIYNRNDINVNTKLEQLKEAKMEVVLYVFENLKPPNELEYIRIGLEKLYLQWIEIMLEQHNKRNNK